MKLRSVLHRGLAIALTASVGLVTAHCGDDPTTTPVEDASPDADTTEPDTTEPDTTEPDTTEPDTTEPDATEPDATEPDATEPDATEPDAIEDTGDLDVDPDVQEPDATEDVDPGDADDAGETDTGPTEPPVESMLEPLPGHWSLDFSSPGMLGDSGARVYALTRTSDGHVYAGGEFNVAGSALAKNIAVWDGADWAAVGVDELSIVVEALAVDANDTVYAAGSAAGGGWIGIGGSNDVMAWDGETWSFVGWVQGEFTSVRALATLPDGTLIAGGQFDGIEDTMSANLLTWDGATWSALGDAAPDGPVNTILVTGDDSFCVGGDFMAIGELAAPYAACWDGAAWQALGDTLPGTVSALLDLGNGDLLAGGTLTFTLDENGGYASGLAHWDGATWTPWQGGVDGGFVNEVRVLAMGPNDEIYVGGTFQGVGPEMEPATNLAVLGSEGWEEVGGGLTNSVGVVLGSVVGPNAMLVNPDGTLIVGGLFSEAGDTYALNIARLNDEGVFEALVNEERAYLGIDGVVNSVAKDPTTGNIVVGGYFGNAGSTKAVSVAQLDKGAWVALGDGLNGYIYEVAVGLDGTIYAGGDVSGSGTSVEPAFLGQWDGTEWKKVGDGVNGPVKSMFVAPNGDLYVGGGFSGAGGLVAGGVGKWDGTDWTVYAGGLDGMVTAVTRSWDGTLYAGGIFSETAAGEPAKGLAMWDGEAWVEVGGGLLGYDNPNDEDPAPAGYASALAFYQGNLLVVGSFVKAGDVTVNGVAMWDGEQWHDFAGGFPNSWGSAHLLSTVATQGNGFFVGGVFDWVDETPFGYVAWWDGEAWQPLDAGLSDLPEQFLVDGPNLWVGGGFTGASGMPSYGLARWIYDQPTPEVP